MKKTIFSFFLILLLFLTACNAGSTEPDVQQEAQPQAEVSLPVDISGLPEGQCYRQTPYLNPIGSSKASLFPFASVTPSLVGALEKE